MASGRIEMTNGILAAALAGALAATASQAATTTVTVGDEDCFGLGSCPDGAPIDTGAVNAGPSDPTGQDTFGTLGTVSFDGTLDLTGLTVLSGSVTARVVGLERFSTLFGDGIAGSTFLLNGTVLGNYIAPGSDPATGAAGPGDVPDTVTFAAGAGLFLDGTNTLTIVPEEAFGGFGILEEFAVDFVRFSVETEPAAVAPVPLPASFWLLGAGALGLVALRRRA
jgi:hypothetical protein